MKKMIGFGAALLCAAVSYADVEGANIVGYNNQVMTNGTQLIGFSFSQINCIKDGKPAVDIALIKPTGYEDIDDLKENGSYNEISFQILKSTGFMLKQFTWERDSDGSDWDGEGSWWCDGTKVQPGEWQFPIGVGISYSSDLSEWDVDNTILPVSGEALVDARNIVTTNGTQAIALPCSFPVRLAADKVIPTGYEDIDELKENGTYNEISFQILKSTGFMLKQFTWERDSDGSDWDGAGSWWCDGAKITEDNDFTLEPGMAIWYTMELEDYGVETGMLKFPGLDDLKKD